MKTASLNNSSRVFAYCSPIYRPCCVHRCFIRSHGPGADAVFGIQVNYIPGRNVFCVARAFSPEQVSVFIKPFRTRNNGEKRKRRNILLLNRSGGTCSMVLSELHDIFLCLYLFFLNTEYGKEKRICKMWLGKFISKTSISWWENKSAPSWYVNKQLGDLYVHLQRKNNIRTSVFKTEHYVGKILLSSRRIPAKRIDGIRFHVRLVYSIVCLGLDRNSP